MPANFTHSLRRNIGLALSLFRHRLRRYYWSERLNKLGHQTIIYPFARIYSPGNVSIGSNVSINDFVHIWGSGGVTIGDNSLIAAHCTITSQSHDANALSLNLLYRETKDDKQVNIGKNVWIGSGAIILPGVNIGDNSIVAAGAVVRKSISPNSLYAGVPAKFIRSLKSNDNKGML